MEKGKEAMSQGDRGLGTGGVILTRTIGEEEITEKVCLKMDLRRGMCEPHGQLGCGDVPGTGNRQRKNFRQSQQQGG